MNRDEMIDSLLGEGDGLGERLDSHDAALYLEAIEVLRAAADETLYAPVSETGAQASAVTGQASAVTGQASAEDGAGAEAAATSGPRRGQLLSLLSRVGAVAAVLTLIATAAFWATRDDLLRVRVYDSSAVYGVLLPEELGPEGEIRPRAIQAERGTSDSLGAGNGYSLRSGTVFVSAIGATEVHSIGAGEPLLEESEIRCGAEGGAHIDLPDGGQLFLPRLSTVQIRRRKDARVALRLLNGSAATVVGRKPIHLAVDGTDLLLTQHEGAAYLRTAESDVTCFRGRLQLHLANGERWTLPAGERLPAACARTPESEPIRIEDYQLDWYDQMLGQRRRRETVEFDDEGRSKELALGKQTQLYLAVNAPEDTTLSVQFADGKTRTFELNAGRTLELRLALGGSAATRGVLKVTPRSAVRAARLLE
jgi:hypothetical protein